MNIRPQSQSPYRKPRRWLTGSLVLAVIGAMGTTAFLFLNSKQPASAQPAIPSGYDLSSWYENGHGGKYLLQVVDGGLPADGVRASGVVLSDTNCEPDAQGLNHCRNGIRLENGNTINVIDNHMMSRNRCLEPGETVSLTTFSSLWVVAVTGQND